MAINKIKAYKIDDIWRVNIGGFIHTLHYSRQTREDVRQWLKERQQEHDYEGYELVFE